MDGVKESMMTITNKQLELYLTYDKKFADIHHLNLMGGYSYLDNTYEGFSSTRSGFDSDAFGYNNLGAGTDHRQGDVGSYKGESNSFVLWRCEYSLMDRYMLLLRCVMMVLLASVSTISGAYSLLFLWLGVSLKSLSWLQHVSGSTT